MWGGVPVIDKNNLILISALAKCTFFMCFQNPFWQINSSVHSTAIIKANIQMSEDLNCTACNQQGCDSVGEKAYIFDQMFVITVFPTTIYEGDNATLNCVAFKSLMPSIEWKTEKRLEKHFTDGMLFYEFFQID